MSMPSNNPKSKGNVTRRLRDWSKVLDFAGVLASILSALLSIAVSIGANVIYEQAPSWLKISDELIIPLVIFLAITTAFGVLFFLLFRIRKSREEKREIIYARIRDDDKVFFHELQKDIDRMVVNRQDTQGASNVQQPK